MKRPTSAQVRSELKNRKKSHLRFYGKRKSQRFLPMLFTATELESLLMIEWLEGYLRALEDSKK